MSYDLYLLRVSAEADAAGAYSQCLQTQEDELNPGPAVEAVEREKRRLAKLLMQFDSNLQIAEFDFEGLASMEGVDLNEVHRRFRHLELNSDDFTGIQITLWDNYAEVTFPYWHSGEQSEAVLRKVWDHLEILQVQGGYRAYDPQLEKVLDLDLDFSEVLSGYGAETG